MMTTFVVGNPGSYLPVHFHLVWNEGSPNVVAREALPPLNVNGLRRLARHLMALADLIEYGQGHRMDEPDPEEPK